MFQASFSPGEEYFVCRQVTSSPVIGTCTALKFPLAIYRDEQIKPKSFPQISTNFLLSTFEFSSFSSVVFALLCELDQRRTPKDPFLKPLNVLDVWTFVLKASLNVAPLTWKGPKYKNTKSFCGHCGCEIEKQIAALLRLLGKWSCSAVKGLDSVQLLSKSLEVLLKNAEHKITIKL